MAEGVDLNKLLTAEDYQLGLSLLSGEQELARAVMEEDVHKLGLTLVGIKFELEPGQIQIFGGSEKAYLDMLSELERRKVLEKLFSFDFPCLILTRGIQPYPEMVKIAERQRIPIMGTELATGEFIFRLIRFLADHLAPNISLHGVLIDVYGIGILILGQSGIGKSETALDLILRGHRLAADDIVEIRKRGQNNLIGKGAEVIKYHMEIRGLGIINIKDLFGIAAIRDRKKIELVIELVEWDQSKDYDRLGLEDETYTILGVEIPHLTIPVRPGRNLTTIIEVAARNQLLKLKGFHSARDFQRRLLEELLQSEEGTGSMSEEIE
jgi:HPr kinase/phosphorylase